jgi:hypothetical protein
MEYSLELHIEVPRQEVIRVFNHTENTFRWQPALKDLELISGTDRSEGACYRMVYEGRKGELEVEETILHQNLPDEYVTLQNSPGVKNTIRHTFSETSDRQTHWRVENHFRFRGMMRLMGPWMKAAFSGNTLLNMERFKAFAENSFRQSDYI